jgi:hypothetical protein
MPIKRAITAITICPDKGSSKEIRSKMPKVMIAPTTATREEREASSYTFERPMSMGLGYGK